MENRRLEKKISELLLRHEGVIHNRYFGEELTNPDDNENDIHDELVDLVKGERK